MRVSHYYTTRVKSFTRDLVNLFASSRLRVKFSNCMVFVPLCFCVKLPVLGGLLTMMSTTNAAADDAWKPASAPLMTKWAKDVSPEHPRPEYPRPLMVRKEWKSLNGIWQFAFDDAVKGETSGQDLPDRILVPFTFESALSGIGKGKEIHEHIWYRRHFDFPASWRSGGKNLLLHFGAVDWHSVVYVNGKQVGEHTGGYSPFSCDITAALNPSGNQELVVAVFDPADPKGLGWQPKGKQLGSEGIWYTRTTGIWQSVWMEPVNTEHIASLISEPDVAGSALNVNISPNFLSPVTFQVQLFRNGKQVTVLVGQTVPFDDSAPGAPPPLTPQAVPAVDPNTLSESVPVPSPATGAAAPATTTPPAPAGDTSDVMRRMMERRQKQLQ